MAIVWKDKVGKGGGSSDLSNDLTASVNVGGVRSGRKYLKGEEIETIIREMLNPVANPTFTPPSANLTTNAAKRIYGVDEPIGTVRFDLSFDQGKITPAYNTSGKRSGTATSYTIDGQSGQSVSINMNTKMPNGERKVTITGVVAYAKGEQPKNSIGENYDQPLAAGSVSSSISFERKPYIYSNKNGSFDRMPIEQYHSSPVEIELANGEHPNEAAIGLPSKAKTIETWDALEKEWEDVSWEWVEQQITLDNRTYWKYTDNRGYAGGERKLRFTW